MILSDFAVACITEGAQQELLEKIAVLEARVKELEEENRALKEQLPQSWP